MDDDSKPGSLFVVVFYREDPSFRVLQLEETLVANLGPEQMIKFTMVGNDLKERFFDAAAEEIIENTNVVSFNVAKTTLLPIRWSVSPPISCTGEEDLYLLPDCNGEPLHSYKYNFRTGSFQNICLPPSTSISIESHIGLRNIQRAVNLGGRIYRLELHTFPRRCGFLVGSRFDCYDPVNDSWKPLKPFPAFPIVDSVLTTAVLSDTILFNVYPCGLLAYDVCGNEWYPVEVNDPRCLGIEGDAVVLENTIYALTGRMSDVVLALSVEKKKGSGGDLLFHCSVRSEIPIPYLSSTFPRDKEGRLPSPYHVPQVRTTHLVHLGKVDFCLVRSCTCPVNSEDPKPILVTYMRLTGVTEMTLLSNHWFKTRHDRLSEVVLCFSLPKCKTTALEEGKQLVFELDPFTPEDNCPNYVRDLPPNVTASQLEQGSTLFGHLMSLLHNLRREIDFIWPN